MFFLYHFNSEFQKQLKPWSMQRQEKRRKKVFPKTNSKIPIGHLGELKKVGADIGKDDIHQINDKKGSGVMQEDKVKVLKQTHISPLTFNSKGNNNIMKNEEKSSNNLLKHIVPGNRHYNLGNRKAAQVTDLASKKTRLPIGMTGAKRSYNGWINARITQVKPYITKRNEEPINPDNIVPRNALHQIEVHKENNGEAYEAETADDPENGDSYEENGYKKDDYSYDKPYRREQKDESPRRRWEDDEEEDEHHHHENMTEHSSFEHRLTEKLLDAILSEHGKHENTGQNEHPNLGKNLF